MTAPSIEEHSRMPSPRLRGLVRRYFERRMRFGTEVVLTFPIRPDLFIDIHLQEYLHIRDSERNPRRVESNIIVVGPHASRLVTGHLCGEVHHFCIQLQPTALHRLLGLPMQQLTDQYVSAADIFGSSLRQFRDDILRCASFDARVAVSERWLAHMQSEAREVDPIDLAARVIRRTGGTVSLEALSSSSGLCERQWRRRFVEQIGLAPKLYARISRLDAILERRRAHPEINWADIAHEHGYADQSHMLRDARGLLGTTPAIWLAEPELGSHALAHHLAISKKRSG